MTDLDRERLSYTLKEAERATGITRDMLLRAIHTTDPLGSPPYLPARKIGRRYVILADELRAWLDNLPDAASNPWGIPPRSARSQAALDAAERRRGRAGWAP